MALSIANFGPTGTNPAGTHAESAVFAAAEQLQQLTAKDTTLHPSSRILQTLQAVTNRQADNAVVPADSSIASSVTAALDTVWQLDALPINSGQVWSSRSNRCFAITGLPITVW